MKFRVRVRVEGKSGAIQGFQRMISSRIRIGTQNLLYIRWGNGRETRETTRAVRNLVVVR